MERLCGKCKARPVRGNGQRWCKECHRVYMRENSRPQVATRVEMLRRQEFARGVEALRSAVIERFTVLGRAEMNGLTAAEIIKQCPMPMAPR